MSLRNNKKNSSKDVEAQKRAFVDILRSDDFEEYTNFLKNPWKTFLFSFLKGTGLGLGTILGTAVVLAILLYLVGVLGGLPVIGEYIRNIWNHINLGK